MSELTARMDKMVAANTAFEKECERYYTNGKWGFYHASDRGEETPVDVQRAYTAALEATRAFYLARDGEKGFLGGRGQ